MSTSLKRKKNQSSNFSPIKTIIRACSFHSDLDNFLRVSDSDLCQTVVFFMAGLNCFENATVGQDKPLSSFTHCYLYFCGLLVARGHISMKINSLLDPTVV